MSRKHLWLNFGFLSKSGLKLISFKENGTLGLNCEGVVCFLTSSGLVMSADVAVVTLSATGGASCALQLTCVINMRQTVRG